MRILRSVAAIVAGLGFMGATVTVGTLAMSMVSGAAPGEPDSYGSPSAATLYLSLVVCGVGAILGGWLAARIASFAPYGHAGAMAAIVAFLSVTAATSDYAPIYPDWYPTALGLVAVLGVLLGGKLRAAAAAATGPVVA